MLVLHKQQPAWSELCLLPLGEAERLRKSCKPWERLIFFSVTTAGRDFGLNQFPPFQEWGRTHFALILKLRAGSSSHWGPLKASQFFSPRFLPTTRSITKGSVGSFADFLGGFLFCFFVFFTVNPIPEEPSCAAFSGIHGLSSSWEKPGRFSGFPRWAVRLKERSGLENYGSFASTALSTFHLNLEQR